MWQCSLKYIHLSSGVIKRWHPLICWNIIWHVQPFSHNAKTENKPLSEHLINTIFGWGSLFNWILIWKPFLINCNFLFWSDFTGYCCWDAKKEKIMKNLMHSFAQILGVMISIAMHNLIFKVWSLSWMNAWNLALGVNKEATYTV